VGVIRSSNPSAILSAIRAQRGASGHGRAPCRLAFTLAEVVIGLAMLTALLGSMFAYLDNLIDSRAAIRAHSAREFAASTLLERLEGDLLTCLVGDSKQGAGVRGDSTTLRILSRGVSANLAERGVRDPLVFCDLQLSEYRFDEGSRLIEARKGAVQPASADGSDPSFWEVGAVAKMRFRYHDGREWGESFDSLEAARLPLAIEVAIWFSPWPAEAGDGGDEALLGDSAPIDEPIFNERDYAEETALEMAPPPLPDRIRVIAILDAEGEG